VVGLARTLRHLAFINVATNHTSATKLGSLPASIWVWSTYDEVYLK
jgi:hypothetical protein